MSATSYDVEIVPEGSDCTNPNSVCKNNTTIRFNDYTFAPNSNGKYQMRIRVDDTRCSLSGPWSNWVHFTVTGMPPNGTVYLDNSSLGSFSSGSNACYSFGVTSPLHK